jgi:hypothetical protein
MEEIAFTWWRSLKPNKQKSYCIGYSLPFSWITEDGNIDFNILSKVYKKIHKIKKHENI